jgi:DNA adenine methylase
MQNRQPGGLPTGTGSSLRSRGRFGGKSRVAHIVWSRFGDVKNYVEPFFGSGAVLLNRTTEPRIETVNDLDGFVANFWRAVKRSPDAVAAWADNPVNECDLHARHLWLLDHKEELPSRLMADPDYYDAKVAGWWVWGICCWIGSGWCSGKGPWVARDGLLVKEGPKQGVNKQLPHLGDAGRGVKKQLPLMEWMQALAARLRNVRVCCGDWARVCGPSVTTSCQNKDGMLTGIFLDPLYADTAKRADEIYMEDSASVAHAVREYAIEKGKDPLARIALCGYEGEHSMPEDWECIAWKAAGGYGGQGDGSNQNRHKERIWFSPACLKGDVP